MQTNMAHREALTLHDAEPIILGVISANEEHHPGWTNKARQVVLNFATTFGKPFSVNDLNETADKKALDKITKTKSGIGGVLKALAKDGQLIKLQQLTHDRTGNVLRRDVGLWATPAVAAEYNADAVVRPQRVSKVIDILKQCSAEERELIFNEMAALEAA